MAKWSNLVQSPGLRKGCRLKSALIRCFAFALCGSHDKLGGSGWKVIILVIWTGHVCISLRGELIQLRQFLYLYFRTVWDGGRRVGGGGGVEGITLWAHALCKRATQNSSVAIQHCSIALPAGLAHSSLMWTEFRSEASTITFFHFFRCYFTEHRALLSAVSRRPIQSRMIRIPQPLPTSRTLAAQGRLHRQRPDGE